VDLFGLPHVGERQQAADFDVDQSFLASLARSALLECLAVFHKPGADRPVPQARLDAAFADQNAVLVHRHAADDDFGILVVNRPAFLADVTRQEIVLRNFADESKATVAAEIHQLSGAGRGNRTHTPYKGNGF
jgi:hypothetical protein